MGHGDAPGALPVAWSDRKNVVWRQRVPGAGWSSPVIAEGRIYLTTAVEAVGGRGGRSLRAMAFDQDSGEPLWDVEVFQVALDDAARIHKKNSHASATPVYGNGRLYVHFGHDGTACLDPTDGSVLWRQESLNYAPVHGNGGSPLLLGDRLIFSADGREDPFVAALSTQDGSVLWKVPREVEVKKTFSFSTPLAIEVKGRTQVLSPGSGALIAYDPADGSEIWRCRYGEGYSVVPRPVFADGLVFVSSGFDRARLLAISPDGTGDVTDTHVAWSVDKGVPRSSSFLVVDGLVYLNDDKGIFSCLEADSGEIVWQERVGGNFSASPLYADGKLYFHSEEGLTTVLEPGRQFRKLAENPLGERVFASAAVVDGSLILRSESQLWRIGE